MESTYEKLNSADDLSKTLRAFTDQELLEFALYRLEEFSSSFQENVLRIIEERSLKVLDLSQKRKRIVFSNYKKGTCLYCGNSKFYDKTVVQDTTKGLVQNHFKYKECLICGYSMHKNRPYSFRVAILNFFWISFDRIEQKGTI